MPKRAISYFVISVLLFSLSVSIAGANHYNGPLLVGSCANYCSGKSHSQQDANCYCDKAAEDTHHDYCGDYFEACAKSPVTTQPPVSEQGYSISYHKSDGAGLDGATLIAGKDSWIIQLSNAKPGDTLYVDAYKDDAPLGTFTICTIPPFGTQCSATGTPQDQDKGLWSEKFIVKESSGKKYELTKISFAVKGAGQAISCTDTDGGVDYYKQGTISKFGVTDYCSNNNQLVEYFCDSNGDLANQFYTCSCNNGACINTTTLKTSESVLSKISNAQFKSVFYYNGKDFNINIDTDKLIMAVTYYDDALMNASGSGSGGGGGGSSNFTQTSQPTSNSCQNSCGSKSKTGSCYCDSASVVQYGDFCKDISTYCPDVWNNPNNKYKNSATGSVIKKFKK